MDCGRGNLRLVVSRLRCGLPIGRIRLRRGKRSHTGLADGGCLRASLKCPQALLELLILMLQLLVLAGELPQLVLKLLNSHFRIAIIGLRQCRRKESLRPQRQYRGECGGAGNLITSG